MDLFGNEIKQELSLADKYLLCPTTVLSKRDPKWQQLKRKWMKLGIKSELGRDTHSELRVKGRDVKDYSYMKDFEGYCKPCLEEKQHQLDTHNNHYDRWGKLSYEQRNAEISGAINIR